MLGAPGVGKGTQSQILSRSLNLPHISTGDIFRDAIKNKTPTGIKIEGYVQSGKLVPDKIVISVVEERISKKDCVSGFIMDGFPRNITQSETFEKLIKKLDLPPPIVLNIRCSKNIIIKRLSSRRVCKNCGKNFNLEFLPPKKDNICDDCKEQLFQRPDDYPTAIRKRLDVYEKETKELKNYYNKKKLLFTINAKGNIDEISKQIHKKLLSNNI